MIVNGTIELTGFKYVVFNKHVVFKRRRYIDGLFIWYVYIYHPEQKYGDIVDLIPHNVMVKKIKEWVASNKYRVWVNEFTINVVEKHKEQEEPKKTKFRYDLETDDDYCFYVTFVE